MALQGLDMNWQRPGCDERCQLQRVILPGEMRAVSRPIHDPVAHEEYGETAMGGNHRIVRTGPLVIDRNAATATRFGDQISLTALCWRVLDRLATKPGRLVSHAELCMALYGHGIGMPADRDNVRMTVYRLRCALSDCGYLIENRMNAGWILLSEPEGSFRGQDWRWSADYDACTNCGRRDREHQSGGICGRCSKTGWGGPGARRFRTGAGRGAAK